VTNRQIRNSYYVCSNDNSKNGAIKNAGLEIPGSWKMKDHIGMDDPARKPECIRDCWWDVILNRTA